MCRASVGLRPALISPRRTGASIPGRYVGVAPGQLVDDEEFRVKLEALQEELEELNAEAPSSCTDGSPRTWRSCSELRNAIRQTSQMTCRVGDGRTPLSSVMILGCRILLRTELSRWQTGYIQVILHS